MAEEVQLVKVKVLVSSCNLHFSIKMREDKSR